MEYLLYSMIIIMLGAAIYLYREMRHSRRVYKEVLKDIEESNKLFDRYKTLVS